MTDLTAFCSMLLASHVPHEVYMLDAIRDEDQRNYLAEGAAEELESCVRVKIASVVRMNAGYRCHSEAYFDADGKLLLLGSYEEM